jgi:hypothetical protein
VTVWGISDLHVGFDVNRRAVEALPARPDDWLIVAGDTGDTPAQLELVLDIVAARFARVIWTPGNHDLWTPRHWPETRRGEAHYQRLVEICRGRGVATPDDPFVVWPGPTPVTIAPCFTLYDYSFAPPGLGPDAAVAWAAETGVQCADRNGSVFTRFWTMRRSSSSSFCTELTNTRSLAVIAVPPPARAIP